MPPTPDDPIVSEPDFATSASSLRFFALTDGFAAMTIGLFEIVETPMKSFIGS